MIYDCITYNGEAELLMLRCQELKGLNVCHVIVESTHTFTGKPKDLKFPEILSKLMDFDYHYVVVTDMPNDGNPWNNERHQRDAIHKELAKVMAGMDDVVIIADCDEIVRKSAVEEFIEKGYDFAALKMDMFSYWLNCRQGVQSWDRARIMTNKYLHFHERTPDKVRNSGYDHTIDNAGFHFSYMGGVERIQDKLNSFSHQECNTPHFNNKETLERKLATGQSLWSDDPTDLWEFVPVDDTFPEYLRNNFEQFKHLIK